MKNFNLKLSALVSALAIMTLAPSANAAEQTDITASVEVANSFDMAATAQLSFGTISAFWDDSGDGTGVQATLSIPSNPGSEITAASTDDTAAKIISIVDGTPATIEITGAAPNTALTVTTPAVPIAVSNVDPTITDTFNISALTTYATTTGGSAFGNIIDATNKTFETDDSGNLTFNLGATLQTQAPADDSGTLQAYGDGTYQATVTVVVDY